MALYSYGPTYLWPYIVMALSSYGLYSYGLQVFPLEERYKHIIGRMPALQEGTTRSHVFTCVRIHACGCVRVPCPRQRV